MAHPIEIILTRQLAGYLASRCSSLTPRVTRSSTTNRLRQQQRAAGSAEVLARHKAEAAELVRLRREVKRLEPESEILKRAAAFFTQEAIPS